MAAADVFLGIIALAALFESAALVALCAVLFTFLRSARRTIESVEERHISPAGARVHAILDDVKDVTGTIRAGASTIDSLAKRIFRR
jgi:hypothetical protein